MEFYWDVSELSDEALTSENWIVKETGEAFVEAEVVDVSRMRAQSSKET